MKSSFYDHQPGMATIENETSVGRERLSVSVHAECAFPMDSQVQESTNGQGAMSLNQEGITKLCEWLRRHGFTT
jgi:hypothetical protein